jgi:hypothetical protein
VTVGFGAHDTVEAVLGRAAAAMAAFTGEDVQLWCVAGHGRGAQAASLLAKIMVVSAPQALMCAHIYTCTYTAKYT